MPSPRERDRSAPAPCGCASRRAPSADRSRSGSPRVARRRSPTNQGLGQRTAEMPGTAATALHDVANDGSPRLLALMARSRCVLLVDNANAREPRRASFPARTSSEDRLLVGDRGKRPRTSARRRMFASTWTSITQGLFRHAWASASLKSCDFVTVNPPRPTRAPTRRNRVVRLAIGAAVERGPISASVEVRVCRSRIAAHEKLFQTTHTAGMSYRRRCTGRAAPW